MDNTQTQIDKRILYMVKKAFPYATYSEIRQISGRPDVLQAIAAFTAEIRQKPIEDIERLYTEERSKERDLLRKEGEQMERERFLKNPNARADFNYHSKNAYWTPREAIAISFGENPDNVKWDLVEMGDSVLAKKYRARKEIIERAISMGQLAGDSNKIEPLNFVKWAVEQDMELPENLLEALPHQKIDWEARCKELQQITDDKDARIKSLEEKVRLLGKPLNPKREATYQKLVYACAVLPTKFDVEAERNTSTAILKGKIEAAGLIIDKEALLAVLRDSNEYCQGQIK